MKKESSLGQVSSGSLLIFTQYGELIRIYCPLQAICIKSVHIYTPGDRVTITHIFEDPRFRLIYQIEGLSFKHHNFEILIPNRNHHES